MKKNNTFTNKVRKKEEEIPQPAFTPKPVDAEEEPGDLPGNIEVKGVFGQELGTSEKFRKKPLGNQNSENNL